MWMGGFAKYVTSTIGAKVTGITISKEQHAFAQRSIHEAGLADRADVMLVDYRELDGKFDKIVSIEMFEAVGQAYWETYFSAVSSLLKRGGRAAIQSITIDDAAFDAYRRDRISSSAIFSLEACCHHCLFCNLRCNQPDWNWLRSMVMACIMREHWRNGVKGSTRLGQNWPPASLMPVSNACGSFILLIARVDFAAESLMSNRCC